MNSCPWGHLGTFAVQFSAVLPMCWFDPGLGVLYVSAESGKVTIFKLNEKKLELVERFTEAHAHSVSVDPESHFVYFPLVNIGGRPVLRIMKPHQVL